MSYNAGNLRPVGQTTGFQSFDTPEAGVNAMRNDLIAKISGNSPAMASKLGKGYQPTLRNLLTVYAPPSENNTNGYIDFVATKANINPDAPLNVNDVDKIMPHMITMEQGAKGAEKYKQYADSGQIMNDATDYSKMSDEELLKIVQPKIDYSKMSDEELLKLVQPQAATEKGMDLGGSRAALQGFNETVPYGNRITAAMGAGIAHLATGEPYSALYDEARRNQEATSQANPNAELAGNVAGIAATLPIGFSKAVSTTPMLGTAANALQKASTTAGNFVRGGEIAADAGRLAKAANLAGQSARSAAVAAPTSALYGAGSAKEGEQLQGAATGAGMGAAVGAAVPIAAAGIGGAIGYGADKLATAIGKRSGEISKESLSAPLQKVYDRLRADYPDQTEFESVLHSLGSSKDKALIEAGGKRVENLAKGAAQYPTGEAKSTEFFNEATGALPEKIKGTLAKTISPSTNYSTDVDNLLEAGRAKATPLYNDAFKANQQIKSPVIDKILQTPEGKSALSEAVANMQNEMARVAKPDTELTQMAREAGVVAEGGVGKGLKLKTLDYIKRSMDDTIKTAIRAGDDGQVRRITALKNSLIDEIDAADKSGLYAKARATAGDYLSTKSAMEQGLEFLQDDAENISRRMSNMSPAEKEAYRAGVVKSLRNDINNKYDGQNVTRLFQKQSNKAKLQDLLSPKDYSKLMDDAMAADNIYKLRNQIIGGSPTAGKQIAAKEFEQAGKDIAIDLATGNPLGAGYKAAKGIVKKMFDGISDKSASEVADILYTKDPKEKYKIIKSLLNESKKDTGIRATEAGQKLKAFYAVSDKIKTLGGNTTQAIESQPSQPLKVTIRPSDKYKKGLTP